MEIEVTRSGNKLGIADVPNLLPGDRLWIHVDLPDDQTVHYLLVVAFLRGTTNPPPENWFTRAETWSKQVKSEGILVTVPLEAQQALLFLAPETGGDFSGLRSAVRSKPGVFVRAAQDLNQASLDRTRSDRYLADIKKSSDLDPKALHDRSVLLARTLGIKLDQQMLRQARRTTSNLPDAKYRSASSGRRAHPIHGGGADFRACFGFDGALSAPRQWPEEDFTAHTWARSWTWRESWAAFIQPAYQYIPALAVPKGSQAKPAAQ